MINRKVDDAIFDVILTHAFREAFAQEMEQIEAEDSQSAQPSEKHRKHERAYYKKMQRKPIKVMTIVRSTAACVAAVICLSFGAMMFSPPVRAAVVDTIVSFYEKYLTVNVSDVENTVAIGNYSMRYVPEGFELTNTYQTTQYDCYMFDSSTERFQIYIYFTDKLLLKYDNEETDFVTTQVNDHDAYIVAGDDGNYVLFWRVDNITISIEGNVSVNVMKKIAEEIS